MLSILGDTLGSEKEFKKFTYNIKKYDKNMINDNTFFKIGRCYTDDTSMSFALLNSYFISKE